MRRDLTMLRALFSGIEIHQVCLDLFCFWKELQYTQNKGIVFLWKAFFLFNGNRQTCVLSRNSHSLIRTVPTFVTAHTFCAS